MLVLNLFNVGWQINFAGRCIFRDHFLYWNGHVIELICFSWRKYVNTLCKDAFIIMINDFIIMEPIFNWSALNVSVLTVQIIISISGPGIQPHIINQYICLLFLFLFFSSNHLYMLHWNATSKSFSIILANVDSLNKTIMYSLL